MLTQLNAVIQALVWTTLAGMMYAIWLNKRESSGRINFGLPVQVTSVTSLLQTMWMLMALALTISLLILTIATRG